MSSFLCILILLLPILLLCILLAALCFFLATRTLRGPRVSIAALKQWVYAHRGLHTQQLPENSLAAFRAAVEADYGIELDVQLTQDGHLVVHHDFTLQRMCGINKAIADCTYEELQKYRLSGTAETIPLFKEVLSLIDGRVPLIIEVKCPNPLKAASTCAQLYTELQGYSGLYCIESFSPFAVSWFRKNAPEVIRGQLSAGKSIQKDSTFVERVQLFLLRNLLLNFIALPDFIAYCFEDRATPGYRLCTKLHHPVKVAWTLRDPQDYTVAAKEFDMVIFEGFRPQNK